MTAPATTPSVPVSGRAFDRRQIVPAAFIVLFFVSSIALFSVIRGPLIEKNGWNEATVMLAYSVFQTVMALTGIFAGRITDRIGPRNVILLSGVVYGVGWFLTGLVESVALFYISFGLIAAIGNGLGYNPALTTGQRWFPDRRGQISGILLAGSTLGPAVLSPFAASFLIPRFGISTALMILGGLFLVTISGAALFTRSPEPDWTPEGWTPPEGTSATDGTLGDLGPSRMLRTPRFWVLFVIFAAAATAGTMLVGSVASIAQVQLFDDPASATALAIGGTVVTVNTLANFVGRLSFGVVFDKLGGYVALIIMLCATILALLAMSIATSTAFFFACLVVLGFSFGALLVIYPPLTAQTFGTSHLGINYGIMFLGYAASTWISSPIASMLKDEGAGRHAYQDAFYGAAAIGLIGIVLTVVLMVVDRRKAAMPAA